MSIAVTANETSTPNPIRNRTSRRNTAQSPLDRTGVQQRSTATTTATAGRARPARTDLPAEDAGRQAPHVVRDEEARRPWCWPYTRPRADGQAGVATGQSGKTDGILPQLTERHTASEQANRHPDTEEVTGSIPVPPTSSAPDFRVSDRRPGTDSGDYRRAGLIRMAVHRRRLREPRYPLEDDTCRRAARMSLSAPET
jgi:hypothetical protein